MAVLVEAISVVVRLDAINECFSGGWEEFLNCVPNGTLCSDGHLARVGFMTPEDVGSFVSRLEDGGLTIMRNDKFADMAVVDQVNGPTMDVDWLEFGHVTLEESEGEISVCRLAEHLQIAAGTDMAAEDLVIAVPDGWTYEDSLSSGFQFIPAEEMDENLKFLRREDNGQEVYLDIATGQEVYVGRSQARRADSKKRAPHTKHSPKKA